MKKILLLLFSLISFQYCYCQNFADSDYYIVDSLEIDKISDGDKKLLDSCLTVYHKVEHDTDKIKAITVIIEASWDDNVWPKYNLWVNNFIKNKLAKNPKQQTKLFLLNNLAGTINNIGYYYKTRGKIEEALDFYHMSLKIKEKVGDKKGIAVGLNNIGIILEEQGDVKSAIKYYHNSLKIQQEIGDNAGVARSYSNIGLIYFDQGDLIKAINYCHKSTKIQEEIGDKKGLATSINNLAAIYSRQGNIKRSLEYYQKSLKLEKEIGNKQGVAWSSNNVGRAYMTLGNYSKALTYMKASMGIGKSLGIPVIIQNAAFTLSLVYEKQNKGIEALAMYKTFVNMRDSLSNEKTQKAAVKQQSKYEYEKKKGIDDAEHDKLIAIEQKEKEKQTIISYATAVGLVLVIVFLLFIFNRLKITRKQKLVIEEQTKEIVDSITYAKRIQEAILPTDQFVKDCLPESFIYYKPKDIVAGDFYWVEQVEDNILFAAADCTGHGVPGAMVSVVCHNAMDRAIREYNLISPGEILDKTREIVVQQFNKSSTIEAGSIDNIRDGMDIALCALNTKTKQLKYAGAFNPLWIIRKGATEIEEIKATRQSVGKIDNPKPFQTHEINLEKGDTIYIFSDGYADQFGGEKGKKLMAKQFKEFLISMKNESIDNQSQKLNTHFENWKGNLAQIDDVCIIGVRI